MLERWLKYHMTASRQLPQAGEGGENAGRERVPRHARGQHKEKRRDYAHARYATAVHSGMPETGTPHCGFEHPRSLSCNWICCSSSPLIANNTVQGWTRRTSNCTRRSLQRGRGKRLRRGREHRGEEPRRGRPRLVANTTERTARAGREATTASGAAEAPRGRAVGNRRGAPPGSREWQLT